MLFFVNTAVRVGEEYNVSKEIDLICFNIMINEKSQKTNLSSNSVPGGLHSWVAKGYGHGCYANFLILYKNWSHVKKKETTFRSKMALVQVPLGVRLTQLNGQILIVILGPLGWYSLLPEYDVFAISDSCKVSPSDLWKYVIKEWHSTLIFTLKSE